MAVNAAIEAEGLTKRYGDFTAVDSVDLVVPQGELFSLLGPNGAGKTTTIKMLCCLLRPTAGTARVLGHDIVHDPIGVKQVIALSPQETAVAGHLNAWENLSLIAGPYGMSTQEVRRRSGELLEMMGLVGRAEDRVKKFSGGMQRRLSIAMALISNPQVLFLDEPTLGLDPQARRAMWEHIEGLKDNKTIVLTTHYLEEADALADHIEIIDDGKMIAAGSPEELKTGISDGQVTVVEAADITEAALAALRQRFDTVTVTESGVEIGGAVNLYDLGDILRPMGVSIQSSHQKTVTLDDVFLELTGKQLRE